MDREKIINKHFHRAFLGYDAEEVDAFLDEILREMDRADQELGIARLRIRILLEELEARGVIPARREGERIKADERAAAPKESPAEEKPPEEFQEEPQEKPQEEPLEEPEKNE